MITNIFLHLLYSGIDFSTIDTMKKSSKDVDVGEKFVDFVLNQDFDNTFGSGSRVQFMNNNGTSRPSVRNMFSRKQGGKKIDMCVKHTVVGKELLLFYEPFMISMSLPNFYTEDFIVRTEGGDEELGDTIDRRERSMGDMDPDELSMRFADIPANAVELMSMNVFVEALKNLGFESASVYENCFKEGIVLKPGCLRQNNPCVRDVLKAIGNAAPFHISIAMVGMKWSLKESGGNHTPPAYSLFKWRDWLLDDQKEFSKFGCKIGFPILDFGITFGNQKHPAQWMSYQDGRELDNDGDLGAIRYVKKIKFSLWDIIDRDGCVKVLNRMHSALRTAREKHPNNTPILHINFYNAVARVVRCLLSSYFQKDQTPLPGSKTVFSTKEWIRSMDKLSAIVLERLQAEGFPLRIEARYASTYQSTDEFDFVKYEWGIDNFIKNFIVQYDLISHGQYRIGPKAKDFCPTVSDLFESGSFWRGSLYREVSYANSLHLASIFRGGMQDYFRVAVMKIFATAGVSCEKGHMCWRNWANFPDSSYDPDGVLVLKLPEFIMKEGLVSSCGLPTRDGLKEILLYINNRGDLEFKLSDNEIIGGQHLSETEKMEYTKELLFNKYAKMTNDGIRLLAAINERKVKTDVRQTWYEVVSIFNQLKPIFRLVSDSKGFNVGKVDRNQNLFLGWIPCPIQARNKGREVITMLLEELRTLKARNRLDPKFPHTSMMFGFEEGPTLHQEGVDIETEELLSETMRTEQSDPRGVVSNPKWFSFTGKCIMNNNFQFVRSKYGKGWKNAVATDIGVATQTVPLTTNSISLLNEIIKIGDDGGAIGLLRASNLCRSLAIFYSRNEKTKGRPEYFHDAAMYFIRIREAFNNKKPGMFDVTSEEAGNISSELTFITSSGGFGNSGNKMLEEMSNEYQLRFNERQVRSEKMKQSKRKRKDEQRHENDVHGSLSRKLQNRLYAGNVASGDDNEEDVEDIEMEMADLSLVRNLNEDMNVEAKTRIGDVDELVEMDDATGSGTNM